jgi:Tfp pilus assembly protein PilV
MRKWNRCSKRVHCATQRGIAILFVLGCVALVSALLLGVTHYQLRLFHRHRLWQFERQAAWLLEAGLDRARAQLAHDATYQGETWKPVVQVGDYQRPASVRIAATPQSSTRFRVEVDVRYPVEPVPSAITISKTAVYVISAPGDRSFPQEDL